MNVIIKESTYKGRDAEVVIKAVDEAKVNCKTVPAGRTTSGILYKFLRNTLVLF
jgi:hypothetical protein